MTTALEEATVSNGLPGYVEPSKGAAVRNTVAEKSHALVDKGDPRVNGPYLDDVRELEEETYRHNRKKVLGAFDKKDKAKSSKKGKKKSKEEDSLSTSRAAVVAELNREVDNTKKPATPAQPRQTHETVHVTKTHPRTRPVSNPSNPGVKEDNLPVPGLEDTKKSLGVVKTATVKVNPLAPTKVYTEPDKTVVRQTAAKRKVEKPAKKTVAKKAPAKKVVAAKKTTTKKTTTKKAVARKK